MTTLQITGPYPIFTDLDGTPLDDGYIFIGDANDDPETNPQQVYWDANLTIPATQPIRTSNGYAYRNGSPALIYTSGDFSITIRNKRNEFVLYSPVGYGFDPAAVAGAVTKDDYVGDGVTTIFALAATPSTALATNVFINGVYQEKDSYTVVGNVLTFGVAPPLSSSIEVITNETGVIGSTNASLVTYTYPAVGAVGQTVQDRLEQYVSVKDFGAVGDGVTDDSDAFIAARTAAAGRRVYVPAGTYKLDKVIDSSEDLIIEGDGNSTVLDFTGTVTGGSYALSASGAFTQIEALGAPATEGSYTITFASAPSLAVGDVFVIYNPTDFSYSGFDNTARAGEWCEVESISGSVVTLKNPLYAGYAVADVDVYKVSYSPKVCLKNFRIRGTTITGLIQASICVQPIFENITGDHANNSVILLDRCFKYYVSNANISNVGDGGDDYGISVGNCQHGRIVNGSVYSRRHAITHGGGSAICSVPVRDCVTTGAVLKNDIDSNVVTADFHGNTEWSRYENCTIYGGVNLQGRNNEYVDCTIFAAKGGYCVYFAEVIGGFFGVRDSTLVTYENPNATGRAIFDVGGNNTAIEANTVEDVYIFCKNVKVIGRNLAANTKFMEVANRGATVKLNIEINGLDLNVDNLARVLNTELFSGTAASDFIIVDNISGNAPAGTFLHISSGTAYRDFPQRLQRQSGALDMTATSGTASTVGAKQIFRYQYPRLPQCQVAATGGVLSNRMVIGAPFAVAIDGLTPIIHSGDATNWSGTSTRLVMWTAEISEV